MNAEIEWSIKNIFIILSALLFAFYGLSYGLSTADKQLKEKRDRMMAMPISDIAEYIISKNSGRSIDLITTIDHIEYNDKTLTYYYTVKSGFLKELASFIEDREALKKRVTSEFILEDCKKTAFNVFMEKGGKMHYIYHSVSGNEKNYLFDVNVTQKFCTSARL